MAFDASLWGRRVEITGLTPGSTQSDYVAKITLSNLPTEAVDAGANSALDGGGDLRVATDSDGDDQLPLEVLSFVTSATPSSRECELWVKFDSYSSSARSVWLFYDRAGQSQPAASSTFGSESVWTETLGCWHLDDLSDSSGSNSDATTSGTAPTQVTGGYSFTNGFWNLGAITLDGRTSVSGFCHHNNDAASADKGVWAYDNDGGSDNTFSVRQDSAAFGSSEDDTYNATVATATSNKRNIYSSTNSSTAVETSTCLTYGASDANLYVNGALDNSTELGSIGSSLDLDASQDMYLGTGPKGSYAGDIFDFILFNDALSADYVELLHDNVVDTGTFWTTGTPEDTTSGVTLTPTGIASAESIGSPTITTGAIALSATAIPSGESFGSPTVVPPASLIDPSGIVSSEAFGASASLSTVVAIVSQAIASNEAFGSTDTTTGVVSVDPSSIGTTEAFGTLSAAVGSATVIVSAIPSGESFGDPSLLVGATVIIPSSVLSDEAFGTPSMLQGTQLLCVSISSNEAFGSVNILSGEVFILPTSIPTGFNSSANHTVSDGVVIITDDGRILHAVLEDVLVDVLRDQFVELKSG